MVNSISELFVDNNKKCVYYGNKSFKLFEVGSD